VTSFFNFLKVVSFDWFRYKAAVCADPLHVVGSDDMLQLDFVGGGGGNVRGLIGAKTM